MSTYSIERSIDLWEEKYLRELECHMLKLKQQMAHELAEAFFRDWHDKPFTRHPETGMLTLRFTATIVEDAELDRIERRAEAVGRAEQRRRDERSRPYGLDEVYE